MSQGYSKQKLFQIGKDNYNALADYCRILFEEGYWEKPETVLNRSMDEMLDLYIQALLIQLAHYCDCLKEDECSYIEEIPRHRMFDLSLVKNKQEEILNQSHKIMNAPPILLQLFSLRDIEKTSSMAAMFFDSLLNILLAMSYINDCKNTKLASFILGYYKQISVFLKSGSKMNYIIDERYVFRKISCEELELSNAFMLTSNGDFEHYKDKYLYHNEKSKFRLNGNTDLNHRKKHGFIEPEGTEEGKEPYQEKNPKRKAAENTEGDTAGETEKKELLPELLEELHSLIGLKAVKNEIRSLINLIKVRKMREEYNMPVMEMSYHMVYTGNPGTGKTTVARLVAKIYKELGILSEGNLVETDRSGLVAGFVGQTALKVKETVEKAIGGVLFIDEAYSLASSMGANDFGSEAIDTLVKLMEDHRDNLVVIVAGYKDEMQQFLKANTGLISRFNKFIDFEDYSKEELLQILKAMAAKAGLMIEEDSLACVNEKLETMEERKKLQFGNARGIRNVFEKIVVNQANRIVTYEQPTKEQLSRILPEDVKNVL